MAVIEGNVVYRERIMLGPDAEIQVQLEDISRSDAPAIVLASTTMTTGGKGPPYPFSLEYDAGKIESRMRYALRAKITQGGRLRFTNTEYIDPFSGNPVEVLVQGIRAPREAAAASLDETRWGLETLEGEPAGTGAGGKQVDLEFMPQEQRVGGFAGCNRYSGSYSREGSTERGASLAFGENMAVTMMACPDGMELEQRFLKVLARVDTFRLDGNVLTLLQGAEQLATFRAL